MLDYEIITNDKFSKYYNYLQKMYNTAGEIINPVSFKLNDKIYVASLTQDSNIYVISTLKDNYKTIVSGAYYKNDQLSEIIIDDYAYHKNEETVKSVSRTNIDTFNNELFICENSKEEKLFHYIQSNPDKIDTLSFSYNATNHPEDIFLRYIYYHNPDCITLETDFIIKICERYIYKDDTYINHIKLLNKIFIPNPLMKSFDPYELYSEIRTLGYNSKIPPELINIYNGTDNTYNNTKVIAENYHVLAKKYKGVQK